jgi:hypothetical protein
VHGREHDACVAAAFRRVRLRVESA